MNNADKFLLITKRIKETNPKTRNGIEAQLKMIDFYREKTDKLDKVTLSTINTHDFEKELKNKSILLSKFNILTKKGIVKGLETHDYAPELNRLHLNNGSIIFVYGTTEINEAITKICNKYSLDKIRTATKQKTRLTWI